MILHPVVAAVISLDALALVTATPAARAALATLSSWAPEAASPAQLRLERRIESSAALLRSAVVLFALSSILVVVALGALLPDVVSGAMCGTGVVQAMGRAGPRLLVFRGLALATLVAWWTIDELGRAAPRGGLAPSAARTILLAAAPLVLAVLETGRAMLSLDGGRPVDCCARIYDATRGVEAGAGGGLPWAWLSLIGAPLVVGAAILLARRGFTDRFGALPSVALVALAGAWIWSSAQAVVEVFAAPHYGVLSHRCPWCLFAARHRGVGYAIWGSLGIAALEVISEAVAVDVGRRLAAPPILGAARRRAARSAARVLAAVTLFLVSAALPTLLWRLRHGRWISGW